MVVSGEAGIGKTRLGEEAAARAEAAGMQVVSGRGWADGGAPPLWPWQPILRALSGPAGVDLLAGDAEGAPASTDHVDSDRFARFAAVTDLLTTVATERPVFLVVDDAHTVDAGALLLVRFVARSLRPIPLVMVLTRRTETPSDAPTAAARLLDEIEAEATPMVLRHFDPDETSEFLTTQGLNDTDPALLTALHKVTGGNPLFLRRIAALGPLDAVAMPTALHTAIDQALGRLAPTTVRTLRLAAVLGASPTIVEIAFVAQADTATVLAAVADGVDAGFMTHDGTEVVGFTHDLVRATLEAGLSIDERLDAHARATAAAVVGEGRPAAERLARRAHHARAAAPRSCDAVTLAVQACQEAAQAMVRNFAYEQADTLLSAAVELGGQACSTGPSGHLLLEWAQAALRCGRLTEARERFDQAAQVAEQEGDPIAFAEAAVGLGGYWVNEHRAAVERARVLGLQRAALGNLPESAVALRCRLRTRLAAEAVFDGGPVEPVFDALDAARACGDPHALAESLSLSHHALFGPEHTRTRLPLADELIQVASEAGDGVLALMGLCWRTVDLFHLGDPRARRALEELRERATALANQNLLYYVAVMDVMLLLRDGRLTAADHASQRAYELGNAAGEVDTLGYLTAQTVTLSWLQDRDAEIVSLAKSVASSPTLIRAEFSLRASAALIVARTGQHRAAQAALDQLAHDDHGVRTGLAGLGQSSTWLVGMVAIVETTAEIGHVGYAREAYDLLLPYADLPVIASVGVVCLGSTERSLGLAAMTFGDLDRAVAHLERAVTANRRLGNRPMVTMAQAELATALSQRDRPGDRRHAAEMWCAAADAADDIKMQARAAVWRQRAAAIPPEGTAVPTSTSPAPAPGQGQASGVIRQEDDRWVVVLGGRRATVPDLVGMGYLATLLTHPNRAIAAITLAGHGAADQPLPQQLLDDKARAAFAERARTSVRKALKRAIDAIATADATIAHHLRATVETGHTCRYDPPSDTPVTWTT